MAAVEPVVESFTGIVEEALFRPVRNGNAFEDTVSRLLQTIRLGIVAPGEALPPERDLAVRFSVSRDTVRDAIRELAEAGYLVSRRGRYGGTFVTDTLPTEPRPGELLDPAELEDVLGLREILELGAARAAAARTLSAADRETLWSRMHETAAAEEPDYRRLDSRLHLTIGELVGVPSLVSLLADNRTRLNGLLDRIPLLAPNIAHSNQQHEAIVIAILTGDPERAAEAMREHLEGSAALLRGFLA
ncbi:FadR/GntR family transcriptional regulator [Galbitalea soli]|uniref:FadR family transcriptional regulator n=1 Tax=Galbitalea soli TaxID=1268042 RepID=A0A7C9TP55_9MICO|nr:FCD domain-containing protein [Galbitalea soli]NEM89744.1 FadR family transcriptional regulator [Galbitalea soli]NYJ30445.1 DNA-binding FadR family transcriptional regulator [Galbitalea soli]